MIELGGTYKDKITGFTGVATAYNIYITGCHQALIQPRGKPDKKPEAEWIDEERLERVGNSVLALESRHKPRTTGFDREAPKR